MSVVIRCTFVVMALICAAAALVAFADGKAAMGWVVGGATAAAAFMFESALARRREAIALREAQVLEMLQAAEAVRDDLTLASELIARSLRTVGDLKTNVAA